MSHRAKLWKVNLSLQDISNAMAEIEIQHIPVVEVYLLKYSHSGLHGKTLVCSTFVSVCIKQLMF